MCPGGDAFGPPVIPLRGSTDMSRAAGEPKEPGTGRSWAEQTQIAHAVAAISASIDGTIAATKAKEDEQKGIPAKVSMDVAR